MKSHALKRVLERKAILKYGTGDICRYLRYLFEEKQYSMKRVTKMLGCSVQGVKWWLKKYGIKSRNRRFGFHTLKAKGYKGWHDFFMQNQYLSKTDMGKELGCHRVTITRAYKKWIESLKGKQK